MMTNATNDKRRAPTRRYSAWEWGRAYAALVLQFPIYTVLWALATFVRTLPPWLTAKLLRAHQRYTSANAMDFRIPPNEAIPVYMQRWWRIPRNWAMNCYLHIVRRSDDDRALHDHPWWNFSIVLDGGYFEHEIMEGGIHKRTWYGPGAMRFRWHGKKAHRLELQQKRFGDIPIYQAATLAAGADFVVGDMDKIVELPATTVFITGPVLRRWGFHHESGWVDAYEWDAFCDARGIKQAMRMDGGSDAATSTRNRHTFN